MRSVSIPKPGPMVARAAHARRHARTANGALSERALRFARFWAETGNGAESARLAGYRGDVDSRSAHACRLLRDGRVQAEIARHMEALGLVTDPAEVVAGVAKMATKAEARDADRLRAYELLGRFHAIWQDVQLIRELPRDPAKLRELIEVELLRVLGEEAILRLADRIRDRRALAAPTPVTGSAEVILAPRPTPVRESARDGRAYPQPRGDEGVGHKPSTASPWFHSGTTLRATNSAPAGPPPLPGSRDVR